jgi:hypothetical protein
MKKQFLTIAIVLLTITTTLFVGCKKDILGCMDTSSTTYNPDATKDNGSCKYEAKAVFWWNQSFYNTMQSIGVANIHVYYNGTFKGTLPVSGQYWTGAPSCGANSTITLTHDLGSSKTQSTTYKFDLMDASNTSLVSYTVTYVLDANTCNQVQVD